MKDRAAYVSLRNKEPNLGISPGIPSNLNTNIFYYTEHTPGRVAQSVGHLTRKSGVLGSIPGLASYFRFSFRFFKKGSCQYCLTA